MGNSSQLLVSFVFGRFTNLDLPLSTSNASYEFQLFNHRFKHLTRGTRFGGFNSLAFLQPLLRRLQDSAHFYLSVMDGNKI